jgi:hypothetical protein
VKRTWWTWLLRKAGFRPTETAIVKGLVADDGKLNRQHVRALYKTIEELGFKPDWERLKAR